MSICTPITHSRGGRRERSRIEMVRNVSPRGVDVLGQSSAPTVTVNGQAAERLGDTFYKALSVSGTAATFFDVFVRAEKTVNGVMSSVETITKHFIAPEPETFTYDNDGNMTSDGRWLYTYDAENRLVKMEAAPNAPKRAFTFAYDGLGRRTMKRTMSWSSGHGTYMNTGETQYVWDGWDLLRENRSDGSTIRYVWNQLHPRGHRALLAVIDEKGTTRYSVTDANGNVIRLYNPTTNTVDAEFEYGPFGEPLRATGTAADKCAIRYSSEYWDAETELYYYGMRYYSPRLGRWLTRDPIQEQGGLNLYNFTNNNPTNKYDVRGLWKTDVHLDGTHRWAVQHASYPSEAAQAVANADEAVDGSFFGAWGKRCPMPWGEQSYHFNRYPFGTQGDTREELFSHHLRTAKALCSPALDSPEEAAVELGTALHPMQDIYAHGDHGRYEWPSIWSIHNEFSLQTTFGTPKDYPDMTDLDFDGVVQPVYRQFQVDYKAHEEIPMHVPVWETRLVGDSMVYRRGYQRYTQTFNRTVGVLEEFRGIQMGCKCKKYFGVW